MSAVHDFRESLAKSQSYEDAPWWDIVYRRAFPSLSTSMSVRDDGWAQRGGIDRVLVLASGKTLYVDEKIREKDYPDFLLEVWSDHQRRVRGWVQKELATDYIAYAFVPSETCHMLPFQTLRVAWRRNCHDWFERAKSGCDGFRIVDAENRNYVTRSIAVPKPVLMDALIGALSVSWAAA